MTSYANYNVVADAIGFVAAVLLAFWFTFWVGSCSASSLSPDDQAALRQAATLNLYAYAHSEAGSPESALERGAFCATAGIMKRQGLSAIDAGVSCDAP